MTDFAQPVLSAIEALLPGKERVLVAIDGRCAAGKTTLAGTLGRRLGCTVVHMDDFFLRPAQRTAQRLQEPGGNIDHERFLEEVLLPLRQGRAFSYRPYDCHSQRFRPPVQVGPARIAIVEGSYSCHPALWPHYDLRVFLTVDAEEQLRRIEGRGDQVPVFRDRWIRLEERYFEHHQIQKRCDLRLP